MFLNPLLLLGLSAISIPIAIHLLNRRKFHRVTWAAMRFLRLSVEQNQRRIKFEDTLLLILRCLLIALLALALARPVLRAAANLLGPSSVTAVLILDNSYSMSQTDGVQSRFDAAKKVAEDLLSNLPAGSSAAVLLASDKPHALIPEPTFDLTLAIRQIKDAPLFDRPTNLLPSLRAAIDTLQGRPSARKEIHLITDGQSAAFRQFNDIRSLLDTHKAQIQTHLLFVGQPEDRNLAITALRLDSALTPVNVPVRLEVAVKNFGKAEARDVPVSIAVDSDPSMDQTTIPAIPPGEQRSISLFARLKSPGHHTITAKLPPDRLPADDTRSVALRAIQDLKILLIDGDPGREPRDAETFFLKAALRPVPRAEWDDYFLKLTIKEPTELDTLRFEDFDAVISANVTDFSQSTLTQLTTYVRTGGALWFFPGDKINIAFYNDQLYKNLHLLPASLAQPRGDANAQDQYFSLQDRNYDHPIASLWRDPSAGSLTSARFFKAYDLSPSPLEGEGRGEGEKLRSPNSANPTRVIFRFSDNHPFLLEHDFGLGRVILAASSADTAWTDLPVRAGLFIPLVHRTLAHLVARQDEHLTLPVGQPFTHIAPVELINKDALITKTTRPYAPNNAEQELHESRRIEMLDNTPTLHFDHTDFAGPYAIAIADSAPIRFATQPDPAESAPDLLTPEQLNLLKENATLLHPQPGATLRDQLTQARLGSELSFPLALAALLLATLETLLAHWFSKSK